METKECILKRRSIRAFKEGNVTDEQIHSLLEAAMAAPSAMNCQPWEYYVVKDSNKVAEIKEKGLASNYNCNMMIVVAGDRKSRFNEDNGYWIQDCSAAVENILLEATNLGLGAVWCGVYPREERVKGIQEILGICDDITPLALIQVGYPGEEKEARSQYDEKKVHII